MLLCMGEEGIPEGQGEPQQRRVYPPAEVQARLEVSASGLRRLAGIYERTVGPLPRDERGRVWPEDAVKALEDARALVRESRAVSIEAALRGHEVLHDAEPYPATQRPSRGDTDPGAAILEELRALRGAIEELTRREEEHTRRISELEEAVRTGRELEAPGGLAGDEESVEVLEEETRRSDVLDNPQEEVRPEIRRGPWRRVLAWFGFGVRRP